VLHPAYEGWRTRRATETWNLKTIDEDDILDNIVMILADFEEDKESKVLFDLFFTKILSSSKILSTI